MTEDLRGLIEKIQHEGVEAANEKASRIETEARAKADQIIQRAKDDAQALINQARQDNEKLKKGTTALLKQAARDTLINLKKEIIATLEGVILSRVREELKPDEVAKMITALVKAAPEKTPQEQIVISLNKALINKLSDHLKKGVALKAADDISAGFIISYDSGKSHYDFTDKALAEYISSQVKPALAEILK